MPRITPSSCLHQRPGLHKDHQTMGNIGNTAKPLYGDLADGSQSFAKEIDESFFCWEPNEKRAEVLARLTREFWRSNAEKAVLTAAKGLSENLDILLSSIRAIDLQRTLAPALAHV